MSTEPISRTALVAEVQRLQANAEARERVMRREGDLLRAAQREVDELRAQLAADEARRLQLLDDAGGLENTCRDLRAEVERLTAEVAELRAREEWLMHAVEVTDTLRCEDREAVVAYLRRKAGKYTLSLRYAALMEAAETIEKAGHPLHAILPHKE